MGYPPGEGHRGCAKTRAPVAAAMLVALPACGHGAVGWQEAPDGGPGEPGTGLVITESDASIAPFTVSVSPASPAICPGQCVSLQASVSGGTPPYAVAWTGTDAGGGVARVCPATTTTYQVAAHDSSAQSTEGQRLTPDRSAAASVTVTVGGACIGPDAAAPPAAACSALWPALGGWWDIGSGFESPWGSGGRTVRTDRQGNIYVAGSFLGQLQLGPATSLDNPAPYAFVVKLDPDCRVLWARMLGNAQASVQFGSIDVDGNANVFFGGGFTLAAVDFGKGPLGLSQYGGADAVLVKLNADGSTAWAHAYPNPADVDAPVTSVAVDGAGAVVFLGGAYGTDFGGGPLDGASAIVKLDAAGNHIFSMSGDTLGNALGDTSGAFYLLHDVAAGADGLIWVTAASDASPAGVVASLQADGGARWSHPAPAGSSTQARSTRADVTVALDRAGSATVLSGAWPMVGAGFVGFESLYGFAPSGTPTWTPATTLPDPWQKDAWTQVRPIDLMTVDAQGNAFVAEAFTGTLDFGALGTLVSAGGTDVGILQFDPTGALKKVARWGGPGYETPSGIAVDAANDVVVSGVLDPVWTDDAGPPPDGGELGTFFVTKVVW